MDRLAPGDIVYTKSDVPIGVVAGFTETGVEVEVPAAVADRIGIEGPTVIPGGGFGEGYLVWRCGECGEMGELTSGMPPRCPNCGAAKEQLYRSRED